MFVIAVWINIPITAISNLINIKFIVVGIIDLIKKEGKVDLYTDVNI
jgi:hypothetical protein